MLEEENAKGSLKKLLPRIIPSCVVCHYFSHQGCGDLRKSIPIKLKTWGVPNSFFIILHDQDEEDCVSLKEELRELCSAASARSAIRAAPAICIVCRELEAWYLGDFDALEKAFPKLSAAKYKNKRKFRNPDTIHKPSAVLEEIVDGFDKVDDAPKIVEHINIHGNTSASFRYMLNSVEDILQQAAISECPPDTVK